MTERDRVFHVKHRAPHILLVNPWITDFAAYNLWIRPIGLLRIASLLKENGFQIALIDCLDFFDKIREYGDGKFHKIETNKPLPLKSIPRNYSQYGIPEEILLKRLSFLEEKPDLIAVTSGMTYWYPGVIKAIEIVKKFFKGVPVLLGGIYAALCYGHALRHSGADFIFSEGGEREALKLISELTRFEIRNLQSGCGNFAMLPYPCFGLYPLLRYVCISTSQGCPFRCPYCASSVLTKKFIRRDPLEVVEEIEYWTTRYQVNNVSFCDDALLIEPHGHIVPILREIIRRNIRCNFHTPNGLHIREIDGQVADLLFRSGFRTIRLGFETSSEVTQTETGGKVDNSEFRRCVNNLKRVGYSGEEIGAYVMTGLPDQRAEEVEESIAFVKETGAKPILTEYSPIPHTPLFEKAKQISPFDLENEPLFHNNSIFPCQWEGFTTADYKRIKEGLGKK